MVVLEPNQRAFKFEFDHIASLAEVVSTVTVSPGKSILFYFVPMIGAWLSGHQMLRVGDRLQTTLISEEAKQIAITKVTELKNIAGIIRNVNVYTSDAYSCASFGGSISLSPPIVSIPRGYLTENGETVFEGAAVPAGIVQPADHWKFTPDEVLFLISRELVNIQSNSSFIRVAAKVFFVAAAFFIYTAAVPLIFSILLMGAAVTLHIISERVIRSRFDIGAVDILAEYFGDQERAVAAATSTLQKLADQNIERRESSVLYEAYIDEKGNNLLDLQHPLLTKRMERIRERFAPPAAPIAAIIA